MNIDSFTDEQLLNLINNTIENETKHSIDAFTGGCIQITTSHNNKITTYKIMLFFGFSSKRNPITYTEDIEEDSYFIWTKAIMHKVKSMSTKDVGAELNKLNERMKSKKSKKDIGKVVGKEVKGSGSGKVGFVRTSYEHRTNIVRTPKFERFIGEVYTLFEERKVLSFKKKINKTDSTKEAFKKIKDIPEGLALAYTEHVQRNRNYAKRLDIYLIAFREGSLEGVESVKKTKSEKTNAVLEKVIKQKELEQKGIIDVEIN